MKKRKYTKRSDFWLTKKSTMKELAPNGRSPTVAIANVVLTLSNGETIVFGQPANSFLRTAVKMTGFNGSDK